MNPGFGARSRPPGRFSDALVWMLTRSPWLGASVLALAVSCAGDVIWPRQSISAAFVGALAALGLTVALLHGVSWSLAFWLVRRLPRLGPVLFWLALSLAAGAWLAYDLGAFVRLHSRYRQLAVYVFAACGSGGALFGLLCAAFQPTVRRPSGFILERSFAVRRALAGVLALVALALEVVDHRLFINQYRDAHVALRMGALWCLMMGLVTVEWVPRPMTRVRWLLVIAGYVTCLITIDERQATLLGAFDARPWPAGVLQVSRSLVDWDRDGYASLLGGGDCAPWDPRIHPGAREIPDNGIDENCILGDAKSRSEHVEQLPPATEPAPFDVVLITVDALNRGHLGLYDSAYGPKGRATSPNLDRWAQTATVFERAYTPGAWTSIAVPSLMRGVYPRRLQWKKYFETNMYAVMSKPLAPKLRKGEEPMHMFPLAFDDPHPPLAEMLQRHGMFCMAVVDDGYSAMLQRGTGIERGFSIFREVDDLPEAQRNDIGTASTAIQLLAQTPPSRRFFLWVHFFGTHWPDENHPGIRRYGSSPADAYDHEVAFLDTQLTRLLDALSARHGPVAVLIAADHGEGLSAITRYHGQTIDEAVIGIPLLVRVPGWPVGRVKQLVGSIDLVPTILALTKTPAPSYLDGVDIAPLVTERTVRSRTLFSDTWRFDANERLELDYAAAYDGNRQFVLDRVSGALYSVNQNRPTESMHLVVRMPADPIAAAVYAYIEETGAIRFSDGPQGH